MNPKLPRTPEVDAVERRLDRGGLLCTVAFALAILAYLLFRDGGPSPVAVLLGAMSAATTSIGGYRVITAIVALRRLVRRGRAEQRRGKPGAGR